MPYTMKSALEDLDLVYSRKVEMDRKAITRIAYRPSKRQRMLVSKKADNLSGRDDLIYKGEDLKRRPR